MKRLKPFTLLLFVLTLLFLCFAPSFIRAGLQQDESARQKDEYAGILSLWHIGGWQAASPVNGFLSKAVRDFENKHAYVFIEITTLTPAKAAEKIRSGEMPDMISFPTGFFADASLLQPLGGDGCGNAALDSSGEYNGRLYGFAYLVNPYLLFYNQELLFEKEIDEAQLQNLTQQALFNTAKTLSFTRTEGKKKKDIYGMAAQADYIGSPFAALAFFQETGKAGEAPQASGRSIAAAQTGGLDLFINKQAAFLIASASALSTLKNSAKNPPSWAARAFSSYSDLVQYMGIAKTEDAPKENICRDFLYSLLNAKNVARTEALGVFPPKFAEELFADDEALKSAFRITCDGGVFPSAFAYAALAGEMKPYAEGALTGDMASLKSIRSLFVKKLYS